jgi:hypothetical protein
MSVRTVGSKRDDDFGTTLLKGLAIVAGVGIIAYAVKEAVDRNRENIKEKCADGVFTRPCAGAVLDLGADIGRTAVRVAPVAGACLTPPIAPGVCFAAISATALKQT